MKFDPRRTALLVIDMQWFFVSPDSNFGRWMTLANPEGAAYYNDRCQSLVIPRIGTLLTAFRKVGAHIAYTEMGSFDREGRDLPGWAKRHNEQARATVGQPMYPSFDDPTCRVIEELAPKEDDFIAQKTTSGPVNSTKLDFQLRSLDIDTVVVAGVVTDVCVAQTTRELGDRNFEAYVVEDACAALNQMQHDAALATIDLTFGYVRSTDEILSAIQA
jgi:nicotinamidase-related amidase